MYPIEKFTQDYMVGDASSTWRATANLFAKSAVMEADAKKRELLFEYAKLYREMADLSDSRETAVEGDEPRQPG